MREKELRSELPMLLYRHVDQSGVLMQIRKRIGDQIYVAASKATSGRGIQIHLVARRVHLDPPSCADSEYPRGVFLM